MRLRSLGLEFEIVHEVSDNVGLAFVCCAGNMSMFVAGLSLMIRAYEDAYGNLEGRRLEALSRLFAQNVRIYVYPMTAADLREWLQSNSSTGWEWNETHGWVSASKLRHAPPFGPSIRLSPRQQFSYP
jgi:hypothetical protein